MWETVGWRPTSSISIGLGADANVTSNFTWEGGSVIGHHSGNGGAFSVLDKFILRTNDPKYLLSGAIVRTFGLISWECGDVVTSNGGLIQNFGE